MIAATAGTDAAGTQETAGNRNGTAGKGKKITLNGLPRFRGWRGLAVMWPCAGLRLANGSVIPVGGWPGRAQGPWL